METLFNTEGKTLTYFLSLRVYIVNSLKAIFKYIIFFLMIYNHETTQQGFSGPRASMKNLNAVFWG